MATGQEDAPPGTAEPTKKKPSRNRYILGQNFLFSPQVIDDIHIKAELGRYRMRGMAIFKKVKKRASSHSESRNVGGA